MNNDNKTCKVSIIIPVYNNSDLTDQCLDSLLTCLPAALDCEIIVVDNASTDKTSEIINAYLRKSQSIKYYRNETNLGFTGACNFGAAQAAGEVLVFLNNDTISLSGWIENGYDRLMSDDSIGIVGARLLYPDNTIQHAGIIFEKRKDHYLPMWPAHIYRNEGSEIPEANVLREYDAVTGACLFIRKKHFQEVNGLDESYGMYFEDIDLCFKVSELNKKIVYEPRCCLIHLEGKSSPGQEQIDELNIASSKIFYDRWRKRLNSLAEKAIKNTVYWLSPIFNPSGYASEAIGYAIGLDDHLDIVIRHQNNLLSQDFIDNLPESWKDVLFRLHVIPPGDWNKQIKFINNPIVIQHQPASAFYKIPDSFCIGRTMFETDRIPQEWIQKCNRMDEIWVPSDFNKKTFSQAGIQENKIFVIPECIDTEVFNPDKVEPVQLPNKAAFNFLSIFEWTNRKGWDILLRSYFEAFSNNDDVCLYLRTYLLSYYDGDTKTELMKKINNLIQRYGYKKENLPRFELLTTQLPFNEMLRLYKSVDAFVLASRGEGWGRPYMEAMTFGLPVIGTNWSGNTEFMNNENSYLIDVHKLVTIKENEINSYLGHEWAEPSKNHLKKLMKYVFENPAEAKSKGLYAKEEIEKKYSLKAVAEIITGRLKIIEREYSKLVSKKVQSNIVWEGDQFIHHSLALVNREICSGLSSSENQMNLIMPQYEKYDQELVRSNPQLVSLINKTFTSADIHVRHQWPPNLEPPKSGRWVMIQPWEFGSLPIEWVEVFNNKVDEFWVYTNYLKNVYLESGISEDRVFVVPLGFSPEKFNPRVKPYKLKTKRKIKFLFLGGTIYRKGIDLLLETYIENFTKSDDVCLVIKDMGSNSFYKGQTIKNKLQELSRDKNSPEIEYIDSLLTEKQLAGLYTASNVLVHPYRGEGFGLPVLEAMACGIPVIVTSGGSTDDFCNSVNSFKINSTKKYFSENKVDDRKTVNRPWLLEPEKSDLIEKMKYVYNNYDESKIIGIKACEHVHSTCTWDKTIEVLENRIQALSQKPIFRFLPKRKPAENSDGGQIVQKLMTEAYSLYENFDYIGSLNKLEQVIKKTDLNNPENLDTDFVCRLFNLAGLNNLGLKNFESAKRYFEEELKLNPNSSTACFGLGELFYLSENYDGAKLMYEWAVANDSSNSAAKSRLEDVNKIFGFHFAHNSLLIEIPE